VMIAMHWPQDLQWKGKCTQKKLRRFPHVFRNSLRPVPNLNTCPSSPSAIEPISVSIPFDHVRKKEAITQEAKANVSHGKRELDRVLKRILTVAVIVNGFHA
jgi:hypothetical protein